MKLIKKIIVFLLIVFVVAQFFGPEKNEGEMTSFEPFLAETAPPDDVKAILKESCFDCHSSVTRYPWYNNITPVNYWMADHIKHGKGHFDVSKWNEYSTKKKDHKLEELIEMVEAKTMPLDSYTWVHKEARLTEGQINNVVTWAKMVRIKYSIESEIE